MFLSLQSAIIALMVITYDGVESIKITQGDLTVALNPISKDSKIKGTSFGSDIVMISANHPDLNGSESATRKDREPFVIKGPGEYEVMGIKVRGIVLEKESDAKNIRTVYLVKMDGLQLCFLGSIEKDLDEGFLEKIGEVDVLFIDGEADAKKIISLIKDADPRIVICYSDENAKMLMKEFGQTVEAQDKVSVKKKDLSEEETKLIWLKEKEK